jgi:hypothetical protein
MFREICIPEKNELTLPIPNNLVGTKVEVLVLPIGNDKNFSTSEATLSKRVPVFGCAKGQFIMADDFTAPLEDFKDYM